MFQGDYRRTKKQAKDKDPTAAFTALYVLVDPPVDEATFFRTAHAVDKTGFPYCARNVHKCPFAPPAGVGLHVYYVLRRLLSWLSKQHVELVRIKGSDEQARYIRDLLE